MWNQFEYERKNLPHKFVWTDGVHLVHPWDERKLHEFAASIGMNRDWFRSSPYPHYVLKGKMVGRAWRAGAQWTTSRRLLELFSS